jgi:hypothetical protein
VERRDPEGGIVGTYSDEDEVFESLGERGDDVQPGGEGGGGASDEESFDADLLDDSEDDA